MPAVNQDTDTPRYLLRAFSTTSGGYNRCTILQSLARVNGYCGVQRLEEFSEGKAADQVQYHVENRYSREIVYEQSGRIIKGVRLANDIFIEFTSSLLVALHHCIFHILRFKKASQENCYIAIIDTSKCPPGTFTRTIDLLNKYDFDHHVDPELRHEYHEGEYLAQYELDLSHNKDAVMYVSIATLVEAGLFEYLPEMNDPWNKGLRRFEIERLRDLYFQSPSSSPEIGDLAAAHALALCFGGKWMVVMEVWFLTLRFSSAPEDLVLEKFAGGSYDMYGFSLAFVH